MSYLKFTVAIVVGITPMAVILAYLGEHLDRMPPQIWWLIAGVVLTFLLYRLYRRRNRS